MQRSPYVLSRMKSLTLTRPDDWHLHLRDEGKMRSVVGDSARQFNRAIIMPNLAPPVVKTADARAYRERILKALPEHSEFSPLMTLYLTDDTKPVEIEAAKESGIVYAAKLYPAGATTNSSSGVTSVENIFPALEKMQELGMPLLIHGEVTSDQIDIFDREQRFLETVLVPLIERFEKLKIVFEHITTKEAAQFVINGPKTLAATVTAHHLLLNRNAILAGGIRPHHYCLPVLKRETHRQALLSAVTGDCNRLFLGTDSAPHAQHTKESACGCAGMYTAFAAIELYAEAFEQADALNKLEAFASFNGPDFYGLPRNQETITLNKQDWIVPTQLEFDESTVVPFRASGKISWKINVS